MKRTFANTLCMMLVLAGYLWGGCVACQQLFAAEPAETCCHHDKCDRGAHERQSSQPQQTPHQQTQACAQQPWVQTAAPDAGHQLAQTYASLPVVILAPSVLHAADLTSHRLHQAADPPGGSPPDLPVLHAALLI